MAFTLALRDGTAKAWGVKLLLVGPENVGKTCVAATLVGDPFKDTSATEGADLDICNTNNWVKISPADVSQRIQHEYLTKLKSCADSNAADATAKVKAQAKHKTPFYAKVVRLFQPGKDAQATQSRNSEKENNELQTPKIELEEIQGAKAAITTHVKNEDGINVMILDFAGQVQYHNTHSAFIRKENVIMVVFDASQPLDQPVKDRTEGQPNTSKSNCMTNLQNILFWMKTVHSICREPGDKASLLPIILLVATKLDLLGDSAEKTKEEIIKKLANHLEEKPYAQHLAGHGEGLLNALRKYCIFLSNKVRDPEVIQRLKKVIVEISTPILSKEHPLVFLKIERALLGANKHVLTKVEFHEMTCRCGFLVAIDSREFSKALQYFHDRGSILHFASTDSLKDLVILSPDWLTKLFSYVLIAHPYKRMGGHNNSFYMLQKKGILVSSFLCTMLGLFNRLEQYTSFKLEQQQAVDLMKNFYFVAKIYKQRAKFLEDMNIDTENEIYIVPSLLPESRESQPDGISKDVYFHFPDSFLPPMLFSQMMAMCINRNEDKRQDILW